MRVACNAAKRFGQAIPVGAFAVFSAAFLAASFADPSFVPFSSLLSSLGVGPFWEVFNAALVVAGVLLLLFYAELGKQIPNAPRQAIWAGRVSSIGLAGVGVFPAPLKLLHALSGLVFFVPAAVAAILLTMQFKQDPKIVFAAGVQVISLALFGMTFSALLQLVCVLAYAAWIVLVAFEKN